MIMGGRVCIPITKTTSLAGIECPPQVCLGYGFHPIFILAKMEVQHIVHPTDPRLDPPMQGFERTCFSQGCFGVLKIGTGLRGQDTGSGNSGGELIYDDPDGEHQKTDS